MRYLLFTLLAVVLCTFAKAQTGTQIENSPFYYSGLKVGLNINTPQYGMLEINGSGASNGLTLWTNSGETTSRLWIDASSNLFHITRGDQAVNGITIKPNGDVGIGTIAPLTNLHISEGSSGSIANNIAGIFVENSGSANNYFVFQTATIGGGKSFSITNAGNVGIGSTNPTERLVVDGTILAEEVKVQNVPQSDYVFEEDYNLLPITEVETFIKENKHLPEIPSAEEFKENGVGLGEMDDMLLRKVEELTLYVIELKKENELQDQKNKELEMQLEKLQKKIKNED